MRELEEQNCFFCMCRLFFFLFFLAISVVVVEKIFIVEGGGSVVLIDWRERKVSSCGVLCCVWCRSKEGSSFDGTGVRT